jgi:hypothetical protein
METDKPEETTKANDATEPAPQTQALASVEDKLKAVVALVEKSVKAKDTRLLIGRLLRQTASVRKQLTASNVKCFLQQTLPADLESRAFLCSHVEQVNFTFVTGQARHLRDKKMMRDLGQLLRRRHPEWTRTRPPRPLSARSRR